MTDPEPSSANFSYEDSPHLYLFTSLTAGSSHIITATSRLETILKVHKIPFKAVDCATDEKARRIWTRRSNGKKLPGLVKEGFIVADLPTVEEWNEYGEIKEHLSNGDTTAKSSNTAAPVATPIATTKENEVPAAGSANATVTSLPIRSADASAKSQPQQSLAEEAAALAKARQKQNPWKSGAFGSTVAKTSKPTTSTATTVPEAITTTTTAEEAPSEMVDEQSTTTKVEPAPLPAEKVEPTNEKVASSPEIPPPSSPSHTAYSGVINASSPPGKPNTSGVHDEDIDLSSPKHNTLPSTALAPINGNGSHKSSNSPPRTTMRASAPAAVVADDINEEDEADRPALRSDSEPTTGVQTAQISSLSTALKEANGHTKHRQGVMSLERHVSPILDETGHKVKIAGEEGETTPTTHVKFQGEEVKPADKASVSVDD